MSEALADEVEAINSIYGDGTLVKSPDDDHDNEEGDIYILTLPPPDSSDPDSESVRLTKRESSSIRLRFPPLYPDEPPSVLGTHRSGAHAKRGAAARDLAAFRQVVGEVYEPGAVCLFDAVERVREVLRSAGEEPGDISQGSGPAMGTQEVADGLAIIAATAATTVTHETAGQEEGPPWVISDPLAELKSTFIARCAPVTSPAQAASYLAHFLATDKRARTATHNISAWRIRGPHGTAFQDCDDDGETAAGGRLLQLMQLMDLWDVMVVVTRWYGGQKLGPRRFALINGVAREVFVRAGLVGEEKKKGRK